MSRDLSKMEVKPCPCCGAEYLYDDDGDWHHPFVGDCINNSAILFGEKMVVSHNRRAPPAELVVALRKYDEGTGTKTALINVVRKICEVGK